MNTTLPFRSYVENLFCLLRRRQTPINPALYPSPAAPPSSRTASGGGGGTSPPARACSARRASTASHLTSQPLARSRRCATR